MTKNKKAQRARQRKSKDEYLHSLRIAATSVAEMLTYMPGLNMVHIDMEKAILAAPDYNYYEKLMLYHINTCARAALILLHNAEQARAQSVEKTKEMSHDLREHMQWLINTAESVNSGDTGWSDLLSDVLKALHKASDTAGEYGPAWLQYSWDDVDDQSEGYKAAAAAQLEREGLALRRKRMFTATQRRRWQDLEVQVEDDDAEIRELEEEEHALEVVHRPAGWQQQQQRMESTFSAAALSDATDYMAIDEDLMLFAPPNNAQHLAEHELPALGSDPAATARSAPRDVYTAMAADLAEYEAEIAMQQQQQPPPLPRAPSQPPPPPPPPRNQQQQQQQPLPRQQQQQAGRGRGRGTEGRGSALQNYQEQRQQQQQALEQKPAPPTKEVSVGAPAGWSPQFAGHAAATPPVAAGFEPCFRNEDFLNDDQMPAVDDLKPVITSDIVTAEAAIARIKLESVIFRHGGSGRTSINRDGGSWFHRCMRTDPDITAYEKVMVSRWWRALCPLLHAPETPPVLLGNSLARQLQEQYDTAVTAKAWVDTHLGHLMRHSPAGATLEQQESMQRMHQAASVILEALERNRCIPMSNFVWELQCELPQVVAAEPGSGGGKVSALLHRTITQLKADGLCSQPSMPGMRPSLYSLMARDEVRRAKGHYR